MGSYTELWLVPSLVFWKEVHMCTNTCLLYWCENKMNVLTSVPPWVPRDSKTFVFQIMPGKDCTTEIKSICTTHKCSIANFWPRGMLAPVIYTSEMHGIKQRKTQWVSIFFRSVNNIWIRATSYASSHINALWFCLCIYMHFIRMTAFWQKQKFTGKPPIILGDKHRESAARIFHYWQTK